MVQRQGGVGLVSSRVELYERPQNQKTFPTNSQQVKSTYRNSDSFTTPSTKPALLVVDQRNGDEEDVDSDYVGSALIENGIQHQAQGEHEKALKVFDVALSTQRISLGTDEHICIAHTHSCIGSVYLKQGKIVHAKKEFEKVLALNNKLGKDKSSEGHDVLIANTKNNLGTVACLAGDLLTSENYHQQALQELRQKNGPKADIADVLFNLGRVQLQTQDWGKAMSNLTEAYHIAVSLSGQNNTFVAQTLSLIGMVQLSTTCLDAALESFLEAHNIVLKLHGEDCHEEVAVSLYHLGLVKEQTGDCKDAWESYTKAREVYTRLGVDQDDNGLKNVRKSIARVEQLIAQNKTTQL